MKQGFIKVAALTPKIKVADPKYNGTEICRLMDEAIQKGAKVIMCNGKRYHDKTIRTKYKGELKPFAKVLIKKLASGEAYYKQTAGKVTYAYYI